MSDEQHATSIPGLTHGQLCYLQIPALDVAASARFYEQVFGWSVALPDSGFESPGLIGQWVTDRAPASAAGPVAWRPPHRRHMARSMVPRSSSTRSTRTTLPSAARPRLG